MKKPQPAPLPDALEIVFAHRNRAYGAYALRREYNANLGKALVIGLLFIASALLLPVLLKAITGAEQPLTEKEEIIFDVGDKVDIEQNKVVIPPPAATPPPAAQTRFVAFVPVPNDQAEATDVHTTEEVIKSEAPVGSENVDGEDPGPDIPSDFNTTRVIEDQGNKGNDEVMDIFGVQKAPLFPGGENALIAYLSRNIVYPELARDANIQGIVVLTFVVKKDGSIGNLEIVKDIGGGCGKEALRVAQTMPLWSPGENNGQAVNVRFTLPVRFQLR
jgi:periplasmic protein TonB